MDHKPCKEFENHVTSYKKKKKKKTRNFWHGIEYNRAYQEARKQFTMKVTND